MDDGKKQKLENNVMGDSHPLSQDRTERNGSMILCNVLKWHFMRRAGKGYVRLQTVMGDDIIEKIENYRHWRDERVSEAERH